MFKSHKTKPTEKQHFQSEIPLVPNMKRISAPLLITHKNNQNCVLQTFGFVSKYTSAPFSLSTGTGE